jgi:hypothetical protein
VGAQDEDVADRVDDAEGDQERDRPHRQVGEDDRVAVAAEVVELPGRAGRRARDQELVRAEALGEVADQAHPAEDHPELAGVEGVGRVLPGPGGGGGRRDLLLLVEVAVAMDDLPLA